MPEAPALRFLLDSALLANEEWGFNCGPASLCALFGLNPSEVRRHMGDFERVGYTNPTVMKSALRSLGKRWRDIAPTLPNFGLVRVQWHGPWMRDGVPMRARYRYTHWIAACLPDPNRRHVIFDVNTLADSGEWIPVARWATDIAPLCAKESSPRADGCWSFTHCFEVDRAA